MLKDTMVTGQSLEDAGAAFVKANRPSSIIQRAASVEEVANMIVYVCSPQASATTGAALRVWRRRRHHRLRVRHGRT
jgi:NAD(P)-dependent dehydrogenase (short-subunit alcohol dehydrogenase family)